MLIRHCNPVEESFMLWVNENPESFNALDMKRFYIFVRSVHVYHAERWKNFSYFKSKIKEKRPSFTEENIELFYNKLCTGLSVLNSPYLLVYSFDDELTSGRKERIVEKGEIVEKYIVN